MGFGGTFPKLNMKPSRLFCLPDEQTLQTSLGADDLWEEK